MAEIPKDGNLMGDKPIDRKATLVNAVGHGDKNTSPP